MPRFVNFPLEALTKYQGERAENRSIDSVSRTDAGISIVLQKKNLPNQQESNEQIILDLAGAVRVELTSTVLETAILTVVLRPYHYYFIILIISIKYFLLGFVIISLLSPPDAAKSETVATIVATLRVDSGAIEVQVVCNRTGESRTRPVVAVGPLIAQRTVIVAVVASVDKTKRRLSELSRSTFSVRAATIARLAASTNVSQVASGGLLLLVLLRTVTACLRTRRLSTLRITITAETVLPFAVWYGRGEG